MRSGFLWRRIWPLPGRFCAREHSLRAVFNGLRYIVKTGNPWRMMPHDLPPWPAVYQQAQRWIRAGCFEMIVEDLRSLLREFAGRNAKPTAMILDSHTIQSTPESGARAGYGCPSLFGRAGRSGSRHWHCGGSTSIRNSKHQCVRNRSQRCA
jgi:transposase